MSRLKLIRHATYRVARELNYAGVGAYLFSPVLRVMEDRLPTCRFCVFVSQFFPCVLTSTASRSQPEGVARVVHVSPVVSNMIPDVLYVCVDSSYHLSKVFSYWPFSESRVSQVFLFNSLVGKEYFRSCEAS